MFQPIEAARPLAFCCLLLLCLPSEPAAAAPFGVSDETAGQLLAELGDRYEVIELSRSYVVRPVTPGADFKLIEIEQEGVRVDGELYDLDQLRNLLDDDAEILFALTGDVAALESLEELRNRVEQQQLETARELEENIRRQVEELERLDSERLEELGQVLERPRRRDSRRMDRVETKVSLGSSLTIKENQSARDVVVVLGPLDVQGEVRGNSVVVLGSAEVTGRVDGHLTVVGGNVSLGPDAVVDGDVNCIGGVVDLASGAEVEGELTEISIAPFSLDLPGIEFEGWTPFEGWHFSGGGFRWFGVAGTAIFTGLLTIMVLLTLAMARNRVRSIAHRARRQPWKSGLVGVVTELLMVSVGVLVSSILIVSIIGIPVFFLLLPLTMLVLVLLLLLGYTGVAAALGQSIFGGRRGAWNAGLFLPVLVGIILIQSWQIVGESLALTHGFIKLSGILLILFGFFLKYLVWTLGLGAVMLDRFSPLPEKVAVTPAAPVATVAPVATAATVAPSPPPLPDLDEEPADEDVPDEDSEYREAGRPPGPADT